MSTRIDTLSNSIDTFGDRRQKTFGGMRGPGMQDGQGGTASGGGWGMEWHGICWRSSDVPPVKTAGARIGTAEAAGGRTPWDLRMWVGGRRVSAGGGIGFAAVAAGEGPRAKGGGLFGGRGPWTLRRGPAIVLGHRRR